MSNETTCTLHGHPQDSREQAFGCLIQNGEVLREGDLFSCMTTGKWESIPDTLIGATVDEHKSSLVFVRPA